MGCRRLSLKFRLIVPSLQQAFPSSAPPLVVAAVGSSPPHPSSTGIAGARGCRAVIHRPPIHPLALHNQLSGIPCVILLAPLSFVCLWRLRLPWHCTVTASLICIFFYIFVDYFTRSLASFPPSASLCSLEYRNWHGSLRRVFTAGYCPPLLPMPLPLQPHNAYISSATGGTLNMGSSSPRRISWNGGLTATHSEALPRSFHSALTLQHSLGVNKRLRRQILGQHILAAL